MLNWAVRYFPILRELRRLDNIKSLLEVGSGSFGIGSFYRARFVGCDLSFPLPPRLPMVPVIATATKLPFADQSFDAVVVSDVLEHVPPPQRMAVVSESLRVTRKIAIFGFPCGQQAFAYDCKLAKAYDSREEDRPDWLEEHMQYPFPTEQMFENLGEGWTIKNFSNENAAFHYWVMRMEMHRLWVYTFVILLRIFPGVMERLLRQADREPYYRRIVAVQRALQSAGSQAVGETIVEWDNLEPHQPVA